MNNIKIKGLQSDNNFLQFLVTSYDNTTLKGILKLLDSFAEGGVKESYNGLQQIVNGEKEISNGLAQIETAKKEVTGIGGKHNEQI